MTNSITDVGGIRVGHHHRLDPDVTLGSGWATGTTVVLTPPGTVGAVDERGGAPGTRETDLLDPANTAFRADLRRFVDERIAPTGAIGALAQTLVKLTAPGVPDLYQGTELWNLRLVDPDNRVPVDYERRERLLEALERPGGGGPEALRAAWRDGAVKLWLTQRALRLRRDHPELFTLGDYIALPAEGPHADRVLAFARRLPERWAVTIVPRLVAPLTRPGLLELDLEPLAGTTVILPAAAPHGFRSVLGGDEVSARSGRLEVRQLWARLPVALLLATE